MKNVQPSIREVAVLQEATEMILSSMDVDTVLHHILLIVRNYFGATNCAVFLLDRTSGDLYCRAQNGYSDSVAQNRAGDGKTLFQFQWRPSSGKNPPRTPTRGFPVVRHQVG